MESLNKSLLNNLWIGLIIGFIVPFFAILIFHLSTYPEMSFKEFYAQIFGMDILPALLSLCGVPNLLMFFIFIWTNKLKSARGVLLATFIYTVVVFIIKFAF